MQLTSNRFNRERGFTLIEMAVVLIIIGVMVASGTTLYKQYRIQKDWDRTQDHLASIVQEIENFYTTYGRYPCPASANAVPGDALYGLEKANCAPSAVGTCVDGVCTYASNNVSMGAETVMEGSVPFKEMNLQEREIIDGYSNRFTYAVTTRMTNSDQFTQSAGGISITDGATPANSMVEPEHSAHFVVISHGADKAGARTIAGVLASPCAGIDGENCNGDSVFISRERDADFDDQIHFHVQATPTEWKSDDANERISLKNTERIIVGANFTDDGSNSEEITLRKYPGSTEDDRGALKVDNKIYTEELCEEDLDNCFQPRRIAGDLATDANGNMYEDGSGNGISCYDPSRPNGQEMQYLQGISNNLPDCTDEIELECPDGQFVSAIVDGAVRCNVLLESCESKPVTTFCEDSRVLPETAPNEYHSVYSGECRYVKDYNAAYFAANTRGKSFAEVKADIDNINSAARDIQPCEDDRYNALVRDTYHCSPDGWKALTPHERHGPRSNFTNNLNATDNSNRADHNPNIVDPNNTSFEHDCWCREEYRVRREQCPSGKGNKSFVIEKHTCPQTIHKWTEIYRSSSLCSCADGTTVDDMGCNAYYDQVNNTSGTIGLEGDVYFTYNVTCRRGTPVQDPTPISVDHSDCRCESGSSAESRDYCPDHETNRWRNSLGQWENGVTAIHRTPWVCPRRSWRGSMPEPGYLDHNNTTTEYATKPCVCDDQASKLVTLSCPDGEVGKGITYEVPYNCAKGKYEDNQDLWTEVSDECKTCAWQSNSGSSLKSVALGVEKGGPCQCGADPEPLCYKIAGAKKYNTWNNCECTPQNN